MLLNTRRPPRCRRLDLTLLVSAALLFSAATDFAQLAPPAADKTADALPRDLEMALALSALPPHLREHATVYSLNPARGFELARTGTNEFHAFVARLGDDAFMGDWPLTSYRDDILYPIAFDNAGRMTHMQIFLDAAEMKAKGTPPGELKKVMQHRFKTGVYKAPRRAGIAYMLSPILRTYVAPEANDSVATMNYPHVMYYAPYVSNEHIGGATPGGINPFVVLPGWHGYMIQALGVTERSGITAEFEQVLGRLCRLKSAWCLPAGEGTRAR